MSRNNNTLAAECLQKLLATGEGAPDLAQKLQIHQKIMSLPAELSRTVLAELFAQLDRQQTSLGHAKAITAELRHELEKLIGCVWLPAIFRGLVSESEASRVWVQIGNHEKIVGVSSDVSLKSLHFGCEVMLNRESTAVVAASSRKNPRAFEIATVAEKTPRGTVIVRHAEEEIEVELAAGLKEIEIQPGDRIRWIPSAAMAYEKIEKSDSSRFLLGEVPQVALSQVGGQDENLSNLLSVLGAGLLAPKLAREYGLSNRCSILLTGPPGCGKTLIVKAALSEISRISGRAARIFVVKPNELEHWLVGSSELNVRNLFKSMREAADTGSLVVLFLDEVESISRTRGHFQGMFSDKLLNAFLAEIDGFAAREGVAIIGTTNRQDLIDPAFLQRITDSVLHVRRPDRIAASDILSVHMGPDAAPYHPNGTQAMATRSQIIETALNLLYSPSSPYSQVSSIKFRDGKVRMTGAREFVSGRLLEQTCRACRHRAFMREKSGGVRGVQIHDMEEAIADAVEKMASLTIHNVRAILDDLPTDLEIVAVERLLKRVSRPHRYLIDAEAQHA